MLNPAPEELLRQLQERDQLVQQLAQEIIHVNQHNRALQQQVDQSASQPQTGNAYLEQQLAKTREDLFLKEKENFTLLERLQQAQQENARLQQYLRDLPDLYRQKFAERMIPFKERLSQVENENHRLQQFIQTQLPEADAPNIPLLPPAHE
jgi:chromosome segregation ATPase